MYPDPSRLEGLLIANQVASRLPALPPCLLALPSISHPILDVVALFVCSRPLYMYMDPWGSRLPVRTYAHGQGARACTTPTPLPLRPSNPYSSAPQQSGSGVWFVATLAAGWRQTGRRIAG